MILASDNGIKQQTAEHLSREEVVEAGVLRPDGGGGV